MSKQAGSQIDADAVKANIHKLTEKLKFGQLHNSNSGWRLLTRQILLIPSEFFWEMELADCEIAFLDERALSRSEINGAETSDAHQFGADRPSGIIKTTNSSKHKLVS